MMAAMDEGIGKVVATVEKLGLADDTLFFFCSDNGPVNPGSVDCVDKKVRFGKADIVYPLLPTALLGFQPKVSRRKQLSLLTFYPLGSSSNSR